MKLNKLDDTILYYYSLTLFKNVFKRDEIVNIKTEYQKKGLPKNYVQTRLK